MSYSFSFGGKNKAAAKKSASRELLRSAGMQVEHSADLSTVEKTLHGFIDACEEGEISGYASGSIAWTHDGDGNPAVNAVNLNASVASVPPQSE